MHVLWVVGVAEAARVVLPLREPLPPVGPHQRHPRATIGGARGGRDLADLWAAVEGIKLVLVGVVLVVERYVEGDGADIDGVMRREHRQVGDPVIIGPLAGARTDGPPPAWLRRKPGAAQAQHDAPVAPPHLQQPVV